MHRMLSRVFSTVPDIVKFPILTSPIKGKKNKRLCPGKKTHSTDYSHVGEKNFEAGKAHRDTPLTIQHYAK